MTEQVIVRLFNSGAKFKASKQQVSADLAGEAAILDLSSGTYYGLDRVGGRIWSLLAKPRTFHELRDEILAEYEVSSERCEADLSMFLQHLNKAGLLEIRC